MLKPSLSVEASVPAESYACSPLEEVLVAFLSVCVVESLVASGWARSDSDLIEGPSLEHLEA